MPDLHRCSKPYRWRQPPRVTRTPQPQRSPSANRCNHSSKCTRNHSQSRYDNESRMKMSERCFLRLTKISSMSKLQEGDPLSRPWSIYRPPTTIQPLHNSEVTGLSPTSGQVRLVTPAIQPRHATLPPFKFECCRQRSCVSAADRMRLSVWSDTDRTRVRSTSKKV
jgi:hypothetical protein